MHRASAFTAPAILQFFPRRPAAMSLMRRPTAIASPSRGNSIPPQPTTLRALLPPSAARVQTVAPSAAAHTPEVDLVSEVSGYVVVIGWLRHYGCTLCMQQAVSWQNDLRRLVGAEGEEKTRIVLVGSGTVEQARQFSEDTGFPEAELYTDPSLKSYKAMGFASGAASVFNRKSRASTALHVWRYSRVLSNLGPLSFSSYLHFCSACAWQDDPVLSGGQPPAVADEGDRPAAPGRRSGLGRRWERGAAAQRRVCGRSLRCQDTGAGGERCFEA
jgi:AhpC/TSA antioxidant enzyme